MTRIFNRKNSKLSSPAFDFYPDGFLTEAPRGIGNPSGKGGGLRGEVKGWSSASRRRMRHYLLKHGAPEGWSTFAATLTVPGPLLPVSQYGRLWNIFQLRVNRSGCGMVWRLEIQKRGSFHWHCLIIAPSSIPQGFFAQNWLDSLHALGSFVYSPPVECGSISITSISSLAIWPGASDRAAQVELSPPGRSGWLRYLQDHATKSKQYQIGENIGRHWGVVGRRVFDRHKMAGFVELSDKQFFVAMRHLQRLATPLLTCEKAAFGRRLGYRVRRGSWGRSIWFSRPDTAKKIIDFVQKYY